MNGGHDLGGMHGLGLINPETETSEPIFHHEWERRAFALTLAAGFLGQWNLDQARYARENQHPADYLKNTYYENWLHGLEVLLAQTGLVDAAELANSRSSSNPVPKDILERRVSKDSVAGIICKGSPVTLPEQSSPLFKVGDEVRVSNNSSAEHTRVPRYVRGRQGVVKIHHGTHVYADANFQGDRRGEHLYSIQFSSSELWGNLSTDSWQVSLDVWEPHLELI